MKINKFWLEIILVALVAVAVIFWQLPQIPERLVFDEVEFARLALSLKGQPYVVYSPLATGHTTMYFYGILSAFEIFGVNNFALRLPAALFGLFASVLFYFVLRQMPLFCNKQARQLNYVWLPTGMAVLFVGQRWYFNFARFGFELTLLLLLELAVILLLFIFFKFKKYKFLILTGIFTGLAYHSYMPGRIFPLLPISGLILYYGKDLLKLRFKTFFVSAACVIIPMFLLILPLQIHLAQHQDIRSYQQFYLGNNDLSWQERAQGTWHNISSTALMFIWQGDVNARHNYPLKPALNLITMIFFITGLAIALWYWRDRYNAFFLMYFALSIVPAIITYPWENPNMLRTGTVMPSVIYFAGLALVTLANKLKRPRLFFVITLCLIIVSVAYDLQTYYRYQVQEFNLGSGITGDLRQNLKLPPER